MSNLPNTVKDITTAIFRAGINQGNRSSGLDPIYTELQTMIPEEGARRIARIIAREKMRAIDETRNMAPSKVDEYVFKLKEISKKKVVL